MVSLATKKTPCERCVRNKIKQMQKLSVVSNMRVSRGVIVRLKHTINVVDGITLAVGCYRYCSVL